MLVLNRARYGVTSLPVSVGGAIRQRLPVQMSASEAKGSRAPRTQRDEGADPARRKAWNSSASRGMYHLHLTGAGEHSNRLGPTGRHDGVRSCTRNFLVAFWGDQPPLPPRGPCWSACSSPRRLRQINRLPGPLHLHMPLHRKKSWGGVECINRCTYNAVYLCAIVHG